MAYHLRQAADPRAAAWLVRAGEEAHARHAPQAAIDRFTRALDDPGSLTPAALLRVVEAGFHGGGAAGGVEYDVGLAAVELVHRLDAQAFDKSPARLGNFQHADAGAGGLRELDHRQADRSGANH